MILFVLFLFFFFIKKKDCYHYNFFLQKRNYWRFLPNSPSWPNSKVHHDKWLFFRIHWGLYEALWRLFQSVCISRSKFFRSIDHSFKFAIKISISEPGDVQIPKYLTDVTNVTPSLCLVLVLTKTELNGWELTAKSRIVYIGIYHHFLSGRRCLFELQWKYLRE